MTEVLRDYLPIILLALLIGIAVGFLVLRPRQRVRLTDSAPIRPHMAAPPAAPPRQGVATEAAVAARNVAGQFLDAPGDGRGPDLAGVDDFQLLKGVGPKLAELLVARGFSRFDQLARLTPEEIERLDAELGPFRGRLQRDRVVEQAAYLARGDRDGFQQRFGKL